MNKRYTLKKLEYTKNELEVTEPSNTNKQGCDFFVVGIGASAGGLEAIEQFFLCMPPDNNMAFVVIQHLSPEYKSFMPELISKYSKMKIYQIQNGMEIIPGCIYLNPPKYTVKISNGHFCIEEIDPIRKINLTIDMFLDSLAASIREYSIGIILSGTGSDGTRGCRSIKEAGGIVIAQDEKTARFNGMPRSVISTKICDYILPPSRMPEVLLKYSEQHLLTPPSLKEIRKTDEPADSLLYIFNILNKQYFIDFSLYKQSTILRCIDRRMRICQILTLDEYSCYLKNDLNEVACLYNSLLIGVTRFFRDAEAFDIIKNKVIPEIIESKENNSTVRLWVAGCCSGEEAYSLAILFKEYIEAVGKNIKFKIFATDIDSDAIEYASNGIYPDSISADVPPNYLNRYFVKRKGSFQISKSIRDMVIFSIHNVINNPPFFKIDFLSCRNLLIYFQQQLQTRVLSTFQFALDTKGIMFLGTTESPGELNSYFSIVDAKWKIFKKKETNKRPLVDDPSVISTSIRIIPSKSTGDYISRKVRSNLEMEDVYIQLIEECLPPSVLVDENSELVQVCGDADKYLKVPRGRASYDIQRMVPKELSTALGIAISKVRKENRSVIYENIRIKLAEDFININLVVKPFPTKKNGNFILVLFEEIKSEMPKVDCIENFDTLNKFHERITDLEQELQYTKESLQSSIEEVETSSEELQSANEELLVSNEELHSTNEELQSVNEELIVLNTQYQYKIQELADLNNDMTNFLNSTTIGTIFLDSNLCVRRFTPAITREVNLIEQDIGRPIMHISHNLINEDLISDAREVMHSLVPTEKEVQSMTGRSYILKYSPYRTQENIIKGVVISLIDITTRKEIEENLRRSKERYERLVELSPFAIFIVKNNIIQYTNSEGLHLLQVKHLENLVGKPLSKYLETNKLHSVSIQNEQGDYVKNNVVPLEDKITRIDGSVVDVEVMFIPVCFEEEGAQLIILRDITHRKLSEQLYEDNILSKRLLDEAMAFDALKNDFFSNLSHELRTPLSLIMSTLQLLESQYKNNSIEDGSLRKHMITMKQNCFRQLRLVNNMIDITKIDSGFYEVNLQNHNIVSVVENIALSVSDYIKSKSIFLTFDTDVEEKIIACDPDNIERIMLNLLSNAIKFTKEGGSINVNIHDKGEEVIISVKDSGIGIPKDKQDIIFDRFRQVDKSLTRNHEGSGIGLSLVKSLVEIHDGKISVESEYGKGTEFIINLPVKTVPVNDAYISEKSTTKSNVEKIHLEFSDIYNLY